MKKRDRQQLRKQQLRKQQLQAPTDESPPSLRRRRIPGMGLAAAGVLATGALVAWLWFGRGPLGKPVSPALMTALQGTSQAGLSRSIPIASNSLQRIAGPAVTSDNKPGVLYMGADFCPYCASLRWPVVVALSRFGKFEDLRYMRSSGSDVYANTVTFSFHGAHYESRYLGFQSVEFADRHHKRLEKPDAHQLALFRRFDAPPYAASAGGIPFLYLGGRYVQLGAPFNPGLLKNLSWNQAVEQIKQKNTPLNRRVMGAANLYTAALCELTAGKPAQVCDAPAVKAASARLPDAS